MPPPDLSGLPLWVQIVAYFVLAACVGLGGGLARLGFLRGKQAVPPAATAEIAAMTIDSSAVVALAAAGEALNVTLRQTNALITAHLEDMRVARDEAAIEAARREGFEAGQAARPKPAPRRRRVVKPKAG